MSVLITATNQVELYAAFAGMAINVINPTDLAAPQLAIPWFVSTKINPLTVVGSLVTKKDMAVNTPSA